ncbi:hypothetical protein [Sphingobacterium sp. SGL-16]|uniref:hypothetical protein n=1 Tax=Sphingobacterium sp. SGL-16 TaxID=2710883 RepID=UPI0013EDEA01|nr:hypothetical protein [Sphingobacterium sp. SGL-16]NGM74732.1 hypothetical protein [Sphingobacterium sp. SGL-16]
MLYKAVKISPKYSKSDWDTLNLIHGSKDWNTAVDIFEDRMYGRFFNQIKILENNKDREVGKFAGFAIIALDCLIIETLQQFYNGQKETSGHHSIAFHNFFQKSNDFRAFFTSKRKSYIFYSHIRCGILHQAQTKKKSLIHIRKEPILAWANNNDIEEGILIQRHLFHQEILSVFSNYCNELRNPINTKLRTNFKSKMDYITSQL